MHANIFEFFLQTVWANNGSKCYPIYLKRELTVRARELFVEIWNASANSWVPSERKSVRARSSYSNSARWLAVWFQMITVDSVTLNSKQPQCVSPLNFWISIEILTNFVYQSCNIGRTTKILKVRSDNWTCYLH